MGQLVSLYNSGFFVILISLLCDGGDDGGSGGDGGDGGGDGGVCFVDIIVRVVTM